MNFRTVCTIEDVTNKDALELGLTKFLTSVFVDEKSILHEELMSVHDVFVNKFEYTEDNWNEAMARARFSNSTMREDDIVTFVEFINSKGNIQKGFILKGY